mgnify:CR=1 FL=1
MPQLKQRQSLRQILTPQQVIQASILQLNVSNLEQKILDELESNPALDQAETQDDEEVNNSEDEEVDFEEDPDEYEPASIYDNTDKKNRELPVREQLDFAEGLVRQLDNFNLLDWERAIAEEILWNLDENGYLAVDPILIADRYDREQEEIKHVQDKLQELDPPGIAARDLQDCLLIQLKGKEETLTYQIVSEYFDDFANHRYDNLLKKLNIDKNDAEYLRNMLSSGSPEKKVKPFLARYILAMMREGETPQFIYTDIHVEPVAKSADLQELWLLGSNRRLILLNVAGKKNKDNISLCWSYDSEQKQRLSLQRMPHLVADDCKVSGGLWQAEDEMEFIILGRKTSGYDSYFQALEDFKRVLS